MELQTIGQVSKAYGISARMLRYYEQIGLIKSLRRSDYAYRMYDGPTVKRLQQIIILRKLQIPVKQICVILDNADAAAVIDIFKRNLSLLENEISALSTIRLTLNRLISELEAIAEVHLHLDLLSDDSVLQLAQSLSLIQKNTKEVLTMDALNKADKQLSKLQDVRIIYLPPMTVAASHYVGENPEANAAKALDAFVRESGLANHKPDLRRIGFDNPTNPYGDSNGYEAWVSIPADMDLPPTLEKKEFHGGLYAAHAAEALHIDHWLALQEWVNDSEGYQSDAYSNRCSPPGENLNGVMEELLNYYSYIQTPSLSGGGVQLDLLLPVKPVESGPEAFIEIEGSAEKCGNKASFVIKNKFSITGFSTFIPFTAKEDTVIAGLSDAFWQALIADGRMAALLKCKKPGAPLLCFSSYDHECNQHNGWRFTICLQEKDIADPAALYAYEPFTKKIDASHWVSFETTKGAMFDPHAAAPKLGYHFNGPISGYLDVYPETAGQALPDKQTVIHCWFPVT